MAFTAKDVALLREKTGCGMMDCKKALTETDGDMDKALEFLREKGLSAAAKKAGRIAADGVVSVFVSDGKAAIIEVNSETDFVAKNSDFQSFVNDCAKVAVLSGASSIEELLASRYSEEFSVEEMLREMILRIGENLKLRRFSVFEGVTETYIHGGGRIGVVVKFETDCAEKGGFKEYAKDICMQVAAANPIYLDKESVPQDVIEEEKKILTAQAINEGKPANIAEKMVLGRIGKYYKDNCLVEQPFVKDGEKSVQQYTDEVAKSLGGTIRILEFVRYEKGEGIAKKEDDFADEVARMTGNK